MDPLLRLRTSSGADLRAFEDVCLRLQGFDAQFSFERVDGLLCSLAATPTPCEPAEWLPVFFGDACERAFADPLAQAQALRALQARLAVLRSQLDPEALFDEPDFLRLEPLMAEWTEEERALAIAERGRSDAVAGLLMTGVEWADGFLQGVRALPRLWVLPEHAEAAAVFDQAFKQIELLLLRTDSEAYKAHIAAAYPDGEPSRDDLLAEACMSVQDLRMDWVDFAPRTPTRRVEATPGRNDPCPCGSGKKFKRCHGA